jgi:hypothetical protein
VKSHRSAIVAAFAGVVRLPAIESPKAVHSSPGAWLRRLARGGRFPKPVKVDRQGEPARRGLRRIAEPPLLMPIGRDRYGRQHWLTAAAAQALVRLRCAASADGIELEVISSYRSIRAQAAIVERKRRSGLSLDEIYAVNAPPGYSEHHSGACVDLAVPEQTPLTEDFERTPAFRWLSEHASDFGWRMSFPRGNPYGYIYEPWHWFWTGNGGQTETRQLRPPCAARRQPLYSRAGTGRRNSNR